jgi:hypothetical protein
MNRKYYLAIAIIALATAEEGKYSHMDGMSDTCKALHEYGRPGFTWQADAKFPLTSEDETYKNEYMSGL